MGILSDNTRKTVKIVVRSHRSFNNTFTLFAANLSKDEDFTPVDFDLTEVVPDSGYVRQIEILYTFTDLIIGQNELAIKLIGGDGVERTSTYTVTREFPHDDWIVEISAGDPPIISGLSPADGATNLSRELQLQWSASDPSPLVYDVFFGKSETPNLVSSDQTATLYPSTVNMKLEAGAIYAWKIITKDNVDGITESPTLTFKVAHAPDVPNSPFPIHNSIEADPTNVTLTWETESLEGNPLTYDVYFGASYTPDKITPLPIPDKFLNVGALLNNKTYYWKIIVSDNKGNTVSGPKWKFKTKV